MTTFTHEREATIQFSDTFGALPVGGQDAVSHLTDFDAALTAEVRNTGRFRDSQHAIGAWPSLGDYGAVLLTELRQQQIDKAESLGIDVPNIGNLKPKGLHPDIIGLIRSLKRVPVGVVNCAPRRHDHHTNGQNGDEFYVGVSKNGVEIYGQPNYLRGLRARKVLKELFRIPNNSGLWVPGEQFRSSCITQARATPEVLEAAPLSDIPELDLEGRVAYVDTFGNVRLEVADARVVQSKLAAQEGGRALLEIDQRVSKLAVYVVTSLFEIPEGELGIYRNPTDGPATKGPGYLELVKRVSEPTGNKNHAYAELVSHLTDDPVAFDPTNWDKINIDITTT